MSIIFLLDIVEKLILIWYLNSNFILYVILSSIDLLTSRKYNMLHLIYFYFIDWSLLNQKLVLIDFTHWFITFDHVKWTFILISLTGQWILIIVMFWLNSHQWFMHFQWYYINFFWMNFDWSSSLIYNF